MCFGGFLKKYRLSILLNVALVVTVLLITPIKGFAWENQRAEIFGYVGGACFGERPRMKDGVVFGGRFTLYLGERLFFEEALGMAPTSSLLDSQFKVNVFFLHANLCYSLTHGSSHESMHAFPFLTVGIGVLDYDPAGPVDAEESWKGWAVNGGLGGIYHLSDRLTVRGDLRDFVLWIPFPQFPIEGLGASKIAHNLEISLGLGMRF